MHPAALLPFALLPFSLARKITVKVRSRNLSFPPNTTTAAVGDTVEFVFYPGNHSVAQSTFDKPCEAVDKGIFSGFTFTAAGTAKQIFTVTLNDTDPIWLYCASKSHCQGGMSMVINGPKDETLEAYLDSSKEAVTSSQSEIGGGVVSDQASDQVSDQASGSSSSFVNAASFTAATSSTFAASTGDVDQPKNLGTLVTATANATTGVSSSILTSSSTSTSPPLTQATNCLDGVSFSPNQSSKLAAVGAGIGGPFAIVLWAALALLGRERRKARRLELENARLSGRGGAGRTGNMDPNNYYQQSALNGRSNGEAVGIAELNEDRAQHEVMAQPMAHELQTHRRRN